MPRLDDQAALGNGPAGQALARPDARADEPVVPAGRGDDPVLAGVGIEDGQRQRVARDHVGQGCRQEMVELVGRERRGQLPGVGDQALEQLRSLGERLAFAGQRQGARQAIPDEDHRREVRGVNGVLSRALHVDNAEWLAAHDQRHGNLAHDLVGRAHVVGILGRVLDEGRSPGPHHPADHAAGGLDLDDGIDVAALRTEADRPAVTQVDRDVAVTEPLDQEVHDLLERRGGGTLFSEQSTDFLDAGDLPRPPPVRMERCAEVVPGAFQRRDRSASAHRQEDAGGGEDDRSLAQEHAVGFGQRGNEEDRAGRNADDDRLTPAEHRGEGDDRREQHRDGRHAGIAAQPARQRDVDECQQEPRECPGPVQHPLPQPGDRRLDREECHGQGRNDRQAGDVGQQVDH
jgi:hypothetical protein